MEPIIALVTLILQIASNQCRSIDDIDKHHDYTYDLSPTHEQMALPDLSNGGHQDHGELKVNELKNYLKVIPYKGNGKLKNSTLLSRDNADKDFPIAVIMASHIEENLRDNIKQMDINDYITKIIDNKFKNDNRVDDHETANIAETIHNEHDIESIPDDIKLEIAKHDILHDQISDLESTKPNEIEIHNKLNDVTTKPTHVNEHDTDNSSDRNDLHLNVPEIKESRHLIDFKLDNDTSNTDKVLKINDLIKSIHDLDKLHVGNENDKKHPINGTLRDKTPERHLALSCKEHSGSKDHSTHDKRHLQIVFNVNV